MIVRDLKKALEQLTDNAFVYVSVASDGLVRPIGVMVCDVTDEDAPLPFLVIQTDIKAPGY